MKNLKLYIFLLLFSSLKLISSSFNNIESYYITANTGVFFNLNENVNSNNIVGGPAFIYSSSVKQTNYGIGLAFETFKSNFEYGLNCNHSITLTNIYEGELTNIKGIKSNNDTLMVLNKFWSYYNLSTFIISPYIGYRYKNFLVSLKPQILYNYSSKIENSIGILDDTSFVSYIGNPEIKKDSKGESIKIYANNNVYKTFELKAIFSLEYDITFRRYGFIGYPRIAISLDCLIGNSQNNTFDFNSGLFIKLFYPFNVITETICSEEDDS